MDLEAYRNQLAGQTVRIIGPGPTVRPMEQQGHEYVLGINAGMMLTKCHGVLFSDERAMKVYLGQILFTPAKYTIAPDRFTLTQSLPNLIQITETPTTLLTYRFTPYPQNWIKKKNTLYAQSSVLIPALCFCRFVGAARAILVGCPMLPRDKLSKEHYYSRRVTSIMAVPEERETPRSRCALYRLRVQDCIRKGIWDGLTIDFENDPQVPKRDVLLQWLEPDVRKRYLKGQYTFDSDEDKYDQGFEYTE